MSKFTIDFFELCILAEACIPPRPIARTMFWQSLTDTYWEQMTCDERNKMFEWINRNPFYEESLSKEEDTQVFHARFDPNNQYKVTTFYNDKYEDYLCFKIDDKYYIKRNISIVEEFIKQVEKLGTNSNEID